MFRTSILSQPLAIFRFRRPPLGQSRGFWHFRGYGCVNEPCRCYSSL